MSNEMYSFEDILTTGIRGKNGSMTSINKIVIPKIQRSYAQGRKNEQNVRTSFIKSLLDCLESKRTMDLGFVYGSLDTNQNSKDFLLLDGQQRLTTLYLLYWYISKRECDVLPMFLRKFVYETRHTSSDFLQKICTQSIDLNCNPQKTPSEVIKSNKWFTIAYEEDPTIDAMLRMLDFIDEQYKSRNCTGIYNNLRNLVCYVLVLENFGLSDDLYIKMNARGLYLVPFENFKADLIKYVKNSTGFKGKYQLNRKTVPFSEYFPIKLDNSYVDIFWDPQNPTVSKNNYHKRFFRFFYRYMAFYLSYNSPEAAATLTKSNDFIFFDADSESKQYDKYLGFEAYERNLSPVLLEGMNRVLDLLTQHYVTDIRPNLNPSWGGNNIMELFEDESSFQRTHRVIYAAVIDYLLNTKSFDVKSFRQWMRIVWNVTENSNIDGPLPQIGAIKALHALILNGAANSVYKAVASYNAENASGAIKEEVSKAKVIINNPDKHWENIFIQAESHAFFKGMVRFFFDPKQDISVFSHRYAIVSKMFTQDGISKEFRKEHILIRAMMSQLNTWKELNELSFTERNEQGHFLKLMLARNVKLWDFFGKILDKAKGVDDVPLLLSGTLRNIHVVEPYDKGLQRAFDRLVYDTHMYDWITSEEESHHWYFRIYLTWNHYCIAVPKKWYARMVIDTDREYIIPLLKSTFAMEYVEPKEETMYDEYHTYWGNNIVLTKQISNQHKFYVAFCVNHEVKYLVSCTQNPVEFSQLHTIYPNAKMVDEDLAEIGSSHYDFISSYTKIEKEVKLHIKKLQSY